jgi:putative acetyltransferase
LAQGLQFCCAVYFAEKKMTGRLSHKLTLLILFVSGYSWSDRTTSPFLCDGLSRLISPEAVKRIASEDLSRRQTEAIRIIGAEGMLQIEKALGRPPFQRIESEREALDLFDRVATDSNVFKPINDILQKLPPHQRWAVYLVTGFHAVSTHSSGHREMVQHTVDVLPKAALLGGNSPRWADFGIGNAALMAAGMASNPRAHVVGVDVAGASLNRSMDALNAIADQVQIDRDGPSRYDFGRFSLHRGSASDPTLLDGQQFDGSSWVLTLFALPKNERAQALRLTADRLFPGGKSVLIDPLPAVSGADGTTFLRQIIASAYRNNEELNALDVALLTAMNVHGLFRIDFMTAAEQTALGRSAGLEPVGAAQPVYYGIASMQVFEKPWSTRRWLPTHAKQGKTGRNKTDDKLVQLQTRVQDGLNRHTTDPVSLRLATNADAAAVTKFIESVRGEFGLSVDPGAEHDLHDIESAYQKKGGFLYTLRDADGQITGTFGLAPLGNGTAEVRKMYLAAPLRQAGLGGKVLDAIIRNAAASGYTKIYAETHPLMKSQSMFDSAGFTAAPPPAKAMKLVPQSEAIWLAKPLPQRFIEVPHYPVSGNFGK